MWRVTVHAAIKRLVEKWLFLETYSGKKRLVYPNDPTSINAYISQQRDLLDQRGKQAQHVAWLLEGIKRQSEHFPNTRFYKGKEGVQRVLNEMVQDRKHITIMSDGQHFYDLIDNDFLEQSVEIRRQTKIDVRMMFPVWFEYFSYTQWVVQQELSIKTLPQDSSLQGAISLWGDKVALHCYEGRFLSTTILEDKKIAGIIWFLIDSLRSSL